MEWRLLDTGCNSPEENMRIDQELLNQLDPSGQPILHLYEWSGNCATYGHFLNPYLFLKQEAIQGGKVFIAKRPTGGGIIFHICDFAFSVLLPASHPKFSINTLENYALINHAVISAIQNMQESPLELLQTDPVPLDYASNFFCMAKPTKYDVIMGGRKIGGAAQRRTKQGLLHQGTISIALLPDSFLSEVLLPQTLVIKATEAHSASLLGSNWTSAELEQARKEMKESLQKSIVNI